MPPGVAKWYLIYTFPGPENTAALCGHAATKNVRTGGHLPQTIPTPVFVARNANARNRTARRTQRERANLRNNLINCLTN